MHGFSLCSTFMPHPKPGSCRISLVHFLSETRLVSFGLACAYMFSSWLFSCLFFIVIVVLGVVHQSRGWLGGSSLK